MIIYTIIPSEMLDMILPDEIKIKAGYSEDYDLKTAVFIKRELVNGDWLVSCKLCNVKYMNNHCVDEEMDNQDILLARKYFGEGNVFEIEKVGEITNRVSYVDDIKQLEPLYLIDEIS